MPSMHSQTSHLPGFEQVELGFTTKHPRNNPTAAAAAAKKSGEAETPPKNQGKVSLPPTPAVDETPLMKAAARGEVAAVAALLAQGADVDVQKDDTHDSALTLACRGGFVEVAKLLIKSGAKLELGASTPYTKPGCKKDSGSKNQGGKDFTPLLLAASAGYDKIVGLLLDNSAVVEAQSKRGKDTALLLGATSGHFEVVKLLLAKNANKDHRNVNDYTALDLAAWGGFVDLVTLLLAHGAELNSRSGSKQGVSPLMMAAMNGKVAVVKLLLDLSADVNTHTTVHKNTALTLAVRNGHNETAALLLEKKANVEHRSKTGLNVLMEAASGGYVQVGKTLLEKGADANAPPVTSSRDTALIIAAEKGHFSFVKLLLSHGAQVNARNKKGHSALWLAARAGHLEMAQALYSAGGDIDAEDNRKVSCLMAAFRRGHNELVTWIVQYVSHLPPETEMDRCMSTCSKDLFERCEQCCLTIQVGRLLREDEAAKNASMLLAELERESEQQDVKSVSSVTGGKKREKSRRKGKDSGSRNSSSSGGQSLSGGLPSPRQSITEASHQASYSDQKENELEFINFGEREVTDAGSFVIIKRNSNNNTGKSKQPQRESVPLPQVSTKARVAQPHRATGRGTARSGVCGTKGKKRAKVSHRKWVRGTSSTNLAKSTRREDVVKKSKNNHYLATGKQETSKVQLQPFQSPWSTTPPKLSSGWAEVVKKGHKNSTRVENVAKQQPSQILHQLLLSATASCSKSASTGIVNLTSAMTVALPTTPSTAKSLLKVKNSEDPGFGAQEKVCCCPQFEEEETPSNSSFERSNYHGWLEPPSFSFFEQEDDDLSEDSLLHLEERQELEMLQLKQRQEQEKQHLLQLHILERDQLRQRQYEDRQRHPFLDQTRLGFCRTVGSERSKKKRLLGSSPDNPPNSQLGMWGLPELFLPPADLIADDCCC